MELEYLMFQLLEEKGIECKVETFAEEGIKNYLHVALYKDKKLVSTLLFNKKDLSTLHNYIWDTVYKIEEAEHGN